MEFSTIKVDIREDRIGIITLNRPEKRNALSIQMRKEISHCLHEWRKLQRMLEIYEGNFHWQCWKGI